MGELRADGAVVEPDVLAGDEAAVVELHDVEDPEPQSAVAAGDPEWIADGAADPEALVGEAVLAVVAVECLDAFAGEVGEDLFVGWSGLGVAGRGAVGCADDVVLGVGREGGEHAIDVVGHLEGEVPVHQRVHLGRGERQRDQPTKAMSSSWMPSGSLNVNSRNGVPSMAYAPELAMPSWSRWAAHARSVSASAT